MNDNINAAGLGIVADEPAVVETPAVEEKPKEEEKPEPEKEVEVQAREYIEPEEEKPKEEEEDGMDPEEKKAIQKMIESKTVEQNKEVQKLNNDIAVGEFITDNPEFNKYKAAIKKYVHHPAYKNVPIDVVAKALAYDDAQAMGAEKERKAQVKAAETRIPGATVRKDGVKAKDYGRMPIADFNKEWNADKARLIKERF